MLCEADVIWWRWIGIIERSGRVVIRVRALETAALCVVIDFVVGSKNRFFKWKWNVRAVYWANEMISCVTSVVEVHWDLILLQFYGRGSGRIGRDGCNHDSNSRLM